jgi:uncharacterized protein (DUF111 family)
MTQRKHIHLQPLGGIAGDMFVAAMLDAFPQFVARVFSDVAAVLPPEAGEPRLERVSKNAIAARHFSLASADPEARSSLAGSQEAVTDGNSARHYRRKPQAPGSFIEMACGTAVASGASQLGTYREICGVIEAASLSGAAAVHALGILRVLAEAEATIHGVPIDEVHFHELAGWDSLMDVVAAGSLISAVGDADWSVSDLPLGSGQVKTQHGLLPVPSPATALILEGYPWRSDGVAGERVTPTGAAIVRYLVPRGGSKSRAEGTLLASGYGAGTRNFPTMANVLRVMAFESAVPASASDTVVAAVQFDIDDMTGEEIGTAADRLRSLPGVLDLLLFPAQGKKGRPVTVFHLLVPPEHLQQCSDAVFAETSTIGLRWTLCDRFVLPRSVRNTGEGVRVKEVLRPDGSVTRKAECDDLQALGGLEQRRTTKSKFEGSR